MSFGVRPFFLIAQVCAVAAIIAVIAACRARNGIVTGIMLALALIFLAPVGYVFFEYHPEFTDGRFRTYKAFYRDLQVGMTREQVLAAMERRYPAGGPRKRPKILDDTPERLGFLMDPEISREPNCEGIFLTFEQGRMTQKVHSPD